LSQLSSALGEGKNEAVGDHTPGGLDQAGYPGGNRLLSAEKNAGEIGKNWRPSA